MTVNKHQAAVSQTGRYCPIDHEKTLEHGKGIPIRISVVGLWDIQFASSLWPNYYY
jgi:hypothetical protein